MLKNITLLTFILLSLVSSTLMAQSSTRATMRVSVNIIEGASIDRANAVNILLSREGGSDLGKFTLKGAGKERAVVSVSNKIFLKDSEGNEIELNINSRRGDQKSSSDSVYLQALPEGQMKSGTYYGTISTTIEYL